MPQHDPDSFSRVIMLAYGAMDHGGPYWCYVAVKPSRHAEFVKAMASKQYNMQDFAKDGFGEVVVSGEGAMPPQGVTLKVAEMFNVPVSQLFQDADPMKTIHDAMDKLNKE